MHRGDAPVVRALVCALIALAGVARAAPTPRGAHAVDPFALRSLLGAGDLDGLEARFAGWSTEGDEEALAEAYESFRHLSGARTGALEAWAAARPRSATARIALATREVGLAWQSLGSRPPQRLTAEASRRVRAHCARAAALLEEALSQDPRRMDAYRLRMEVARLLGDRARAEAAFRAGLRQNPAHYGLWHEALSAQRRRWGGSYEGVDRLAREAQSHVRENPRLALLLGYADADRASDCERPDEALAWYDRALSHGDVHWVLSARGRSLYRLGRHREALADLDRALELRPWAARTRFRRALVLGTLDRYEAALADARTAARLDPSSALYAQLVPWVLAEARRDGASLPAAPAVR